MTREELKVLLLKNPLSLDHDAIWRHDQSQREEIAQLREALGGIYDTANWYVTPLAEKICKLAQAALAKEATRDKDK